MRSGFLVVALAVSCSFAQFSRAADEHVGLRIRFGMKDADGTDWSGTISPSAGKVESIRGWRWMPGDHASGESFTVMSRRQGAMSRAENQKLKAGQQLPMNDNGIIVVLSSPEPDETIKFDAKPGKFEFKLSDVPYGKKIMELGGNAEVTRVPVASSLVDTEADEDYPSVAVAKDGTIYLAYTAFTRGKDFQGERERPTTPESGPVGGPLARGAVKKIEKPEDFDYLAEPAGGEQIFLRTCKGDKWSEPVAVTDGKNEIYRPVVAVDGSGKVWIFYPEHLNAGPLLDQGDWDLMARSFDADGKNAAAPVNISNAPGTDFMAAAATDSSGKVVVAFVGSRGVNFNIFTATQDGEKFSAPTRLTDATANEWEPAVAADANGHVAIGWDTYAKGDYDVYMALRGDDGKFAKPQAVAATLGFEVRPSMAYDKSGKLWIAWEESGDQWGKDFGGLKKKGIPLYNGGRALAVKAMMPDGQWMATPDIMDAMPTRKNAGRLTPAIKTQRMANPIAPCYPRIAVDPDGHVYVTFRGRPGGNWRVGIGSSWCEFVTRLDGDQWDESIWLPRSNNTLDNRPAVTAPTVDGLTVVYSGDGRGELNPIRQGDQKAEAPTSTEQVVDLQAAGEDPQVLADDGVAAKPRDPESPDESEAPAAGGGKGGKRAAKRAAVGTEINDDLFVAYVRASEFGGPAKEPKLEKAEAVTPAAPAPDVAAERAAIQAMRDYRVDLNGESLKIWRGEFHRHTEFSFDGGGDGGILDLWRYAIDSAGLDWIGDGDHDYGSGREYSWWITQKTVTLFTQPEHFTPVFSYERSVSYPEGHRNCMFAQRGVRSLPRLPLSSADKFAPAPDTDMLYMYLKRFHGLCAPHTSGTDMGTDWRNNDPEVEPFVEIFQGDRNNYERPDAPRSYYTEAKLKQSTPEKEAMGGFEPKGFVNLALLKGVKYAFECSSDHISTHLAYTNVFLKDSSRENILDAIRKKRVYGSTDNIIADVECKAGGVTHFMGESFSTSEAPTISIHIVGAQKLANVTLIKDDVEVKVWTPGEQDVKLTWADPNPTLGKESYYYVRGEQVPDMAGETEGELVWASPMWIKYQK